MSSPTFDNDIDQYLQNLQDELQKKRARLEKIEEEQANQDMAYELKRNQAEENVRQELVDYEGQGLGVAEAVSEKKLSKPTPSSIMKVLKTLFE